MERYSMHNIIDDLLSKMVFVGGPRQVGKTTLAFSILGGDETHPGYLNWDYLDDKQDILQGKLPSNQRLIVLDEIHKYRECGILHQSYKVVYTLLIFYFGGEI